MDSLTEKLKHMDSIISEIDVDPDSVIAAMQKLRPEDNAVPVADIKEGVTGRIPQWNVQFLQEGPYQYSSFIVPFPTVTYHASASERGDDTCCLVHMINRYLIDYSSEFEDTDEAYIFKELEDDGLWHLGCFKVISIGEGDETSQE